MGKDFTNGVRDCWKVQSTTSKLLAECSLCSPSLIEYYYGNGSVDNCF